MRLLMVSGDRQLAIGERGPFATLLTEFARQFERIDVLSPRPPRAPTTATFEGNVHLHPAPVGRSRMAAWIASEGAKLIAAHEHALITSHDYGWFYNGIGSARLSAATQVPYLSEIHHVPGHPVAADLRERFDKRVARTYVRWARSRAAAFRVVNQVEMPALLESWGVPRSQILVLPSLYIDFDTFRPAAAHPPLEQDVCFVGRMVNNKGLDRIVDALAILAGRGTVLRALFVGKGPLREATRARAQAKGVDARFVEWVESPADLAAIYRASRVVVCASTCEGGPRFTVEAMACGTPVVSTRVGVMNELIQDGQTGRLAGFDAGSLADAIVATVADEGARRALGEAGRQAVQPYERVRTIRGYADGLKALAGRSGRKS
ncbi:MAG: glycosyltransferase family 4 protein [Planctomycetota bacterium]|nr:glycosyltransferase family 4 protein [Planctomycetota bacterium]